jgi:hypothetical protein
MQALLDDTRSQLKG